MLVNTAPGPMQIRARRSQPAVGMFGEGVETKPAAQAVKNASTMKIPKLTGRVRVSRRCTTCAVVVTCWAS